MPFMVVRGDDNGHIFLIKDDLAESAAIELSTHLNTGHKQWISVWKYRDEDEKQVIIKQHNLKVCI
jgi:hypothetical protein